MQDISVWRSQRDSGVEMAQVLTTSSATVTTTARLEFYIGTDASYRVDNIMAVSNDLATYSTYAYDNANELLTMATNGVDVAFTYDDWGRMVTKAQELNGREATYTYRFGDKLYLVNSNFFDEAASTSFVFDGLGKRRATGDGTNALKWYRWGFGWDMLAEYDDDGSGTKIGTQTREYFGQAEAVGTGYASYTWKYYGKDHLGSTRNLYDASKASLGHYDYSPYGDAYLHTGADVTHLYTGHDWTSRVGLYFAPYRFYNPGAARWISRDPMGMGDGPNLYGYVGGNPSNRGDPSGLQGGPAEAIVLTGAICSSEALFAFLAQLAAAFGIAIVCKDAYNNQPKPWIPPDWRKPPSAKRQACPRNHGPLKPYSLPPYPPYTPVPNDWCAKLAGEVANGNALALLALLAAVATGACWNMQAP